METIIAAPHDGTVAGVYTASEPRSRRARCCWHWSRTSLPDERGPAGPEPRSLNAVAR